MSHSYSCLFFHVVWTTKYRMPFVSREARCKIYEYIGELAKKNGVLLLAIGGTYDHVHMLVKMDATQSLPMFIRIIKSKSSKFINQENKSLDYFAWQKGYSVFSVSPSMLNTIKNYIAKQEVHHQVSKFEDEIDFLFQL